MPPVGSAQGQQNRTLDPLELELQRLWAAQHWFDVLTFGPLQKQYKLLTIETSIQISNMENYRFRAQILKRLFMGRLLWACWETLLQTEPLDCPDGTLTVLFVMGMSLSPFGNSFPLVVHQMTSYGKFCSHLLSQNNNRETFNALISIFQVFPDIFPKNNSFLCLFNPKRTKFTSC